MVGTARRRAFPCSTVFNCDDSTTLDHPGVTNTRLRGSMSKSSIIIPLAGVLLLLLWSSLNTYLAWFRPDLARKDRRSVRRTRKSTERILDHFVLWGASDLTLWFIRLMGPLVTVGLLAVLVWIVLLRLDM